MSGTGNTNIVSAGSGDHALRPISIRLLYVGMLVVDDIYDSSGDRLLLSAGSSLTSDQLERMYRLNGGNDTIYVTGRTHKIIATKRPDMEIARRVDLEDKTGYTPIVTRVRELYHKIRLDDKVDREGFCSAADKLSKLVSTTDTSDALSLVNAISPVEEYLYRHIINVSILNALIAKWLKLPEEQVDKLLFVGLLHDCGMACVPQAILHAPHKITLVEHEAVKMHTMHTDRLLSEFPPDIRITADSHHERIDGSGYPKGIKSDAVTGASRITAVSDIYEAVVSARPYRDPISPFHALAMLDKLAPEKIDSNVVTVLKMHLPQHLVGKPVTMSDNTIGIVREFDPKAIEFPKVEINKRILRTNNRLYCASMYNDD